MTRIRSQVLRVTAASVVAAVGAALSAGPAFAGAINSAADCPPPPPLTQPFLSWGDSNNYVLVAGQKPGSFDGPGWTLTGGASIVKAPVADGTNKNVLNLPSGSQAISPAMCVTTSYPTARMMVRNVVGAEGVLFSVSYQNTPSWNSPQNTGQIQGTAANWTLSDPVNLQPNDVAGWQVVRFVLTPGGTSSDFRIYNFYVDPYSKR